MEVDEGDRLRRLARERRAASRRCTRDPAAVQCESSDARPEAGYAAARPARNSSNADSRSDGASRAADRPRTAPAIGSLARRTRCSSAGPVDESDGPASETRCARASTPGRPSSARQRRLDQLELGQRRRRGGCGGRVAAEHEVESRAAWLSGLSSKSVRSTSASPRPSPFQSPAEATSAPACRVRRLAADRVAAGAEVAEVERRRRGLAVHDVRGALLGAAAAAGARGADQDVAAAVAVDVAERRDRRPARAWSSPARGAEDPVGRAARPPQVDRGPRRAAEHHVRRARVRPARQRHLRRPDQQLAAAVAVDVAERARATRRGSRTRARRRSAPRGVAQRGPAAPTPRRGPPKTTNVTPAPFASPASDCGAPTRDVGEAVAVEVAGAGDGGADVAAARRPPRIVKPRRPSRRRSTARRAPPSRHDVDRGAAGRARC